MNRIVPLALAGLVSAGCIQFPERDGRWLAMAGEPQETRVLYAEKMKKNGVVAGAIGTPIGVAGLVVYVIGLSMIITADSSDTTTLNNGLALGLGGAVVGATGLGIGITGFQSRSKWAEVIAAGASYLRIVGPAYGFFGLGLTLYFASQGAGRLGWPLAAGVARLLLAAAGGWVGGYWLGWGLPGIFVAMAAALVVLGGTIAAAVRLGAWR